MTKPKMPLQDVTPCEGCPLLHYSQDIEECGLDFTPMGYRTPTGEWIIAANDCKLEAIKAEDQLFEKPKPIQARRPW